MRTQKNLFKEGNNPNYHEVFTANEATIVKMVLDERKMEYNDIEHAGIGRKSIRFYLDANDDQLDAKLKEYENRMEAGDYNKAQFDYEYKIYFDILKV
jgi:hypothetical protein